MIQQLSQTKKSALRDRIKCLEDEIGQLRKKVTDDQMLISKEDHRKFVENLHAMHKQEIKKSQD
jgi:hypothetical protein